MSTDKTTLVIRGDADALNDLEKTIRKEHQALEVGPSGPEVNALEAASDMQGMPLNEFAILFDRAPVALILVDRNRQVIYLNRDAGKLAGRVPREMVGNVTGVALGCPNEPLADEGCGHGSECGRCGLRRVIETSFERGERQKQVEITASFGTSEGSEARTLRVSTCLVTLGEGQHTLLAIEEPRAQDLPVRSAPGKVERITD